MKEEAGNYQGALGRLREVLARLKPGSQLYEQIVAPRDQVLARYQPVFVPDRIDALTQEEFVSFLYFDNNRHWTGFYRGGLGASRDMPQLQKALKLLLDETQPLQDRFTKAVSMVHGMGKGLATGILMMAYPDRYGVWNNTSEAGMKMLGIWPEFPRGDIFGSRYARINGLLTRLAGDLKIDLWTLDALWWSLTEDGVPTREPGDTSIYQGPGFAGPLPPTSERFALERQLEQFLLENWGRTDLGREWVIYSDESDEEAGNQYPTTVGRIDILAKHRQEPRWLVIELKRDQSSDETVGQVLRYMGWVKLNLAGSEDRVEGLIIAHKAEDTIRYALSAVPNVRLMRYEVQFHLHPESSSVEVNRG